MLRGLRVVGVDSVHEVVQEFTGDLDADAADEQGHDEPGDGVGPVVAGEATINDLERKLADKTRECTRLQRRLDAAATAIAALHHDNTALREQLDRRSTVTSLASHRD